MESTSGKTVFVFFLNSYELIRSRIKRAAVFSFSTFAGVMIATRGNFNPEILVLATLSTFLISLSVYLLNDAFDFGVDRINAPERPLVAKSVSRNEDFALISLMSLCGISIGFFLGPIPFVITLVESTLGILYSVKPFNLKDKFIVKTLCIGTGGVLANLLGGIASGVVNVDLLFCSAMFVVFIFSTSPLNDLSDYLGDKIENRKTIPIVIGPNKTVKLSILMSVAPPISALILFEVLSFNSLSVVLLSVSALLALRLLIPLEKPGVNLATVQSHHKKMVYLHFLLQTALILGSLPL
jgi:4-hydroxybenzoate polyprenyltransferase